MSCVVKNVGIIFHFIFKFALLQVHGLAWARGRWLYIHQESSIDHSLPLCSFRPSNKQMCVLLLFRLFRIVSQASLAGSIRVFPASQIVGGKFLGCILFGSVQDGIYALGKAHMRSSPTLRRFPNVGFETIPMFVVLTRAFCSS